ncbi:hypothetical protein Q5752_001056 [Cryptotrichosporon argae]
MSSSGRQAQVPTRPRVAGRGAPAPPSLRDAEEGLSRHGGGGGGVGGKATGADGQADAVSAGAGQPWAAYRASKRLVLAQLVSAVLLAVVVFMPPNGGSGASAVIQDTASATYVGVLRACAGETCSAWLANSTSSALELDTSALFLSTGLAALVAFYMALLAFVLTLTVRFLRPPPSAPPPKADEEPPKTKKAHALKAFAFRAARLLALVDMFVVLGVTARCTELAIGLGTADIGAGIYVLWLTFVLLFITTLIEVYAPRWLVGTPGWLQRLCGCGACCGCGSHESDDGDDDDVRQRTTR